MKATRHNGRAGSHGVYNPKHNDRRFDPENSEHIDADRIYRNIYWDCYNGFTNQTRNGPGITGDSVSFETVEELYYFDSYHDHVSAQNVRNEKARHPERNRTTDDLLHNRQTCPEETIYQIGDISESVDGDILADIAVTFFNELDSRFGEHMHILDWALHLDEGTPHIHERHVFDCPNEYGEICPQQEKALELLGFDLPDPGQKKSKYNNRKMSFDSFCRNLFLDICDRYRLDIEREPTYGGRKYLEKQEYIIEKQREELSAGREQLDRASAELATASGKLDDTRALLDELAETAYNSAAEVLTEKIVQEVHSAGLGMIKDFQRKLLSGDSVLTPGQKKAVPQIFAGLTSGLASLTAKITERIRKLVHDRSFKDEIRQSIASRSRKSILEMLENFKKKTSDSQAAGPHPVKETGPVSPDEERKKNHRKELEK